MPIYEVTQEGTGITLELEGERPPNKEDVERAFAFAGTKKYANAPVYGLGGSVLQAPPSLYEQAKAVAPSLARVAAPLAFGRPMPEDIATTGRVIQQGAEAVRRMTGGREKPEELLQGASQIEREGILALGTASPEKRELAASLGGRLGEVISEYTPIPESVTRPVGQVAGQVSADLFSPMNLMSLGIAGAARQASRIPQLVAGAEFAETTTPSAVRAAQIADLTRASEAAAATEQAGRLVAPALLPPITIGAAESTGMALQTVVDPNATPEQKLKASLEAGVGMLFSAGLGAQVGKTFGMKRGVTQAQVLEQLASRKQTVGEAISKVEGLLNEMDQVVPVENLRDQFRRFTSEMNPDDPFIFRQEPVGEGPRSRSRFVTEEERTAVAQEQAFQEANQQAALEKAAEVSGTPLKTAEQLFQERQEANKPPVITSEEVPPAVRDYIAEAQARRDAAAAARGQRAREVGQPPVIQAAAPEGTPLRSTDEMLAERLRVRDERIAAEQEAARSETLRGAEEIQAQRSAERQAQRERAAAIRSALGRRELTVEELMREESDQPRPSARQIAEELRRQIEPRIEAPEVLTEPRPAREGGLLPQREAVVEEAVREGTPLRSAEDIMAERLRARDERVAAEQQRIAAEQARVPLETASEKLARALESRDRRLAAEAAAEALESGAARGESVRVTRATVEKLLRMKEKPAGQAVAEETIFNEVWNKALEETQGKFRQKAETLAQRLEGLRAEVEPGVGANPFPQLMGAAWNGALTVAQAVIRAGGTVADGVAAGIRYAKQNFKGKFDEAEFSSQLTRTIQTPSRVNVPPAMEPRRFAERVAAAPGVPPVIREAVAASPEAAYKRQNVADEAFDASTKSDRELTADIIDPESNTRVISGMEQFNRQIASGDMDGASKTALSLAKSGTTWGQLINQFKLLKSASREGVVQLVTKSLEQNKRKPMTPQQAEQLGTAMDQFKIAQDAVNAARIEARTAFESNNTAEIKSAIDRIIAADTLRMEADVTLNETVAKINPSSAADLFISLVQGSVMAPLSIVKNVVYNAIRLPMIEVADMTTALIDMAVSGNKNNAYNYRSRILERIKAFGESLPAFKRTLLKGSNANPYELGTNIGNPLNFQRAWKNLYEAMQGEYNGNVVRNIVEATVGVMPDIMLRLTQATDLPFRQSARAVIISEIGRMRGLTDGQIKLAIRDPELVRISDKARSEGRKGLTAEDINTIEFEAARAVFQQDNAATKMVSGLNRVVKQLPAGSVAYIPYRLINLFQKTPINVAAEVVSFTPAAVLQGFNWKNMTVRAREQAFGRLIVGSMVMGAFSYLYDKGVITPNLDTPGETNKARELAKAGGVMPPGTINVSGLRRLTTGQDPSFQPGDIVKDLSGLGTAGALGIIVGSSKRIAERARIDEPDLFAIGKGSILSGINFIMEQQFLKGTSEFIKLLSEESEASLERFIKSLNVTAASPIAPATLASLNRARREYIPVTGGEGILKDTVNELNQRYAALRLVFPGARIPGAKDPDAMPMRRNLWGDAVKQTPKNGNPWIDQFVDFWNRREIDADPLNASIYRVWRRTADNKAIPSVPNPQLTYKNQTFERMTPDQYDRYAQLVGFYRRMFAERAFMSGAYQQLGDESRIKFLSEAYDRGLEIGKLRFLQEIAKSGQTLTPVAPRRGFEE
jgi:fused signal recognition particle receptor